MKFFATLIAKLTGSAEAPKTLDQARATFGEAKSALDKIGAMFTAAALDFDDFLTKGENSLRDFVVELKSKVTTAETALTEANGKVSSAEQKFSASDLREKASATLASGYLALLASIGFKPGEIKGKDGAAPTIDELIAGTKSSFATHIGGAVQQKCEELGIPASKLPKPGGTPETAAKEMSYEDFSKLSAHDKMKFCTSGGKLTSMPLNILGKN